MPGTSAWSNVGLTTSSLIPRLLPAAPFPSPQRDMRDGKACQKTSVTTALASSITLSRFRPEPLLSLGSKVQRKVLLELGIRADHLSKAEFTQLSNGQRTTLQSHLSFHLSRPASPLPVFISPSLLSDGQKELTCSVA